MSPQQEEGWRYELEPRALRDPSRLDRPLRQRIFDALDRLAQHPDQGDRRKLQGREAWRLRVGDYRILFSIDHLTRTFLVFRIAHRREVYRD